MARANTFLFYPRRVLPNDALSSDARFEMQTIQPTQQIICFRTPRRFVIPPVSDHFADPVPAHGPYIFSAFQNQLWPPPARFSRPDLPPESQMSPYQSASVIGVDEGPESENSSKDKIRANRINTVMKRTTYIRPSPPSSAILFKLLYCALALLKLQTRKKSSS